ncbi:GMC oxidoreductase [Ceratobasidium sp. AG-Ba]|nr:GMC oxidoreductase [Ceratobasidium sp. AG-Ba]
MGLLAYPITGIYLITIPSKDWPCMQIADDGKVTIGPRSPNSDTQKWNITKLENNNYRITSLDNKYVLSWNETEDVIGDPSPAATCNWNIAAWSPRLPRLRAADKLGNAWADARDGKTVKLLESNSVSHHEKSETTQVTRFKTKPTQHWLFEAVETDLGLAPSFESRFFTLSVEEAAHQDPGKEYDIIIVGSGIGGGVLAHDLFDTNQLRGKKAKRILLLEKGGLVFHSHCLNTARPDGLVNDRGQQNDTFFRLFRDNFVFDPPMKSADWNGGPMFALGGRSSAWGLFAPRVHDDNLQQYFHSDMVKDLQSEYYGRAEKLMLLSSPATKTLHQHIMDRLNIEGLATLSDSQVQWQWGRIASEFREDHNYDFAQGAYSSIDKILEIAMSKPVDANGKVVEHEHFKTVLNADVRSLGLDNDKNVNAVNVRTREGKMVSIPVKSGGQVVLCAGSVHSPAILMRTPGITQEKLLIKGGLRLTDHDIWFYSCSFRYSDPAQRAALGPMKLQSYVMLGKQACLANMSIDASSFLPRGESPDDDLPQFIMVFILPRQLVGDNSISIDANTDEPVIKMKRGKAASKQQIEEMQKLTASAMNSLVESAGLRFIGFRGVQVDSHEIVLKMLQLGGVAHECGTLPADNESNTHCLDANLALDSNLANNVYICDLSVLPISPESNPTLTLAALAIRLSRHLCARVEATTIAENQVRVVNHTGAKIKVWLSSYKLDGSGGIAQPAEVLAPGDDKDWEREPGAAQCLLVFKLDLAQKDQEVYLDDPVIMVAHPGKTNPIHA